MSFELDTFPSGTQGVNMGKRSSRLPLVFIFLYLAWLPTCTPYNANYHLVGCFVDKPQRAVPYSGKTFSGPGAIDKCAEIAARNGHRAFGVQYGGQCFTGPRAHETYKVYGKASDNECKNGLGGTWRNNVYLLTNYRSVGCFVDKPQRAVPFSEKTFSGPSAIDECAAIAVRNGYRAFGVQAGGQCFTGPRAHETYMMYGKASDNECKNGLGGGWRNDVYLLTNYHLVGCFVDKPQRAIPFSGKTFSGPSAIDECAAIAVKNGHRAFGVQAGGQCFTGPRAHETYMVYGKASDNECKNGLGGGWRNDVYLLMDGCRYHKLLNEFNRGWKNTDRNQVGCDNNLQPGWYRFSEQIGIQMPNNCVPEKRCGTDRPGWLNGNHPTTTEGVVTRQVCYTSGKDCCKFKNDIDIQNCGDFFVYLLRKPPACNLRYCSNEDCVVFSFEHGVSDWTKTGLAFYNQPTFGDNPTARNRGQPANQVKEWWIGTYENRPSRHAPAGLIQGDTPTGTMTSPEFTIRGKTLSFLIGGGCNIKVVYVELLVGGVSISKETGSCHETMVKRQWDVSAYTGKKARIRLVDAGSGGWEHINFDHLVQGFCENNLQYCTVFTFEHGISDWSKTGTAFNTQPTFLDNPTARNRGQPANQVGEWWIGTYENRPSRQATPGLIQGDAPKGTLKSPKFQIRGNTLSFLIGGGCNINAAYAELLVGGESVSKETGSCSETMKTKVWDVSGYTGKNARIRLADVGRRGWEHINFDHLVDSFCEEYWQSCVIFTFEHGLSDWTKTGTAFNTQPTYGDNPTARNRGQPANQVGDWWIGTYENRPSRHATAGLIQGDAPTGTLTSPEFTIRGKTLSFLIGGGCNINVVYAELLVDDVSVAKETGSCHETMVKRQWDVSAFTGRTARIRLVDEGSRTWDHINFDQLVDSFCEDNS